MTMRHEDGEFDIAIIGMAGRFPGSPNHRAFFRNLCAGTESITFFSEEELLAAGLDRTTVRDPNYVPAAPILDEPGGFDPAFFGFTPSEAVLMDPQHRLVLELAWEAVEDAGYDSARSEGRFGVFACCAMNTYLLYSGILPEFARNYLPTLIANDKDFLATRISHRLGLTGPSMTVQTACSSSLVAVHLACQSLLGQECDVALAGGAAVRVPHCAGHLFQTGSVFTPDGHCRPFDAGAAGTIFGSGGGMVVLKRLADALADGDAIAAVIKGSAVNNDGASKAEYTAPSIISQADVVAEALANAGVEADRVGYVETHGTGTYLGDPIEVAALTRAFRQSTDANGFCAIGSVKSNIGHLDAAAGIASLIKTAMAIRERKLPPSLHFEEPNPQIDFASSPFFVNAELRPWPASDGPWFAGVTSLGIGGTNAHVVLGEAPVPPARPASPAWQLLPLAARSEGALERMTARLGEHLRGDGRTVDLGDVAFTLQTGRRPFRHRRVAVARDVGDAGEVLERGRPPEVRSGRHDGATHGLVMMFSGQGAQYPGMTRGLFERFPSFQADVEQCASLLASELDRDLLTLLYPNDGQADDAAAILAQTRFTQPALFVAEYALARLLIRFGLQPDLLLGHSIGEYVAACLAGVFPLEDALRLVATRGRLMQEMPEGAMLGIPHAADELTPRLPPGLELACLNSTALSVVAGERPAIEAFAAELERDGVTVSRTHTSHAFHSAMMEPVLEPFARAVREARPRPPEIPVISNVTGEPLTLTEATDPMYWARHLRSPVNFAACLDHVLAEPDRVLLEVGPGRTLATFAQRHAAKRDQLVLTTIRPPLDQASEDPAVLLSTVGRLWLEGFELDWPEISGHGRQRVSLPAYPFEHRHIWPDKTPEVTASAAGSVTSPDAPLPFGEWFHVPSLSEEPSDADPAAVLTPGEGPDGWLLLMDDAGVGERLLERLEALGHRPARVRTGSRFERSGPGDYRIDPRRPEDYQALLAAVVDDGRVPRTVVHLFGLEGAGSAAGEERLEGDIDLGFSSLVGLARALGSRSPSEGVRIVALTSQAVRAGADERLRPGRSMALAALKVIPQEFPELRTLALDLREHDVLAFAEREIDLLLADIAAGRTGEVVARRARTRWVQGYRRIEAERVAGRRGRLRERGVVLMTGGFGRIGLALARHLAESVSARLVLLGRSGPDGHEHEVEELERLGGEVLAVAADVADSQAVRNAVDQAVERFGRIDGVIHAAGTVDPRSFATLSEMKSADLDRHVRTKVQGALNLIRALENKDLDFCLLVSSLSSVLGGLRYGPYAAANTFLDAYGANLRQDGRPVFVVNWDAWSFDERDAAPGLLPSEGVRSFAAVIGFPEPAQIIVSKGDLERRLDRWVRLQDAPGDEAAPSPVEPEDDAVAAVATLPASGDGLIETIKTVWQRVTGIDEIDPDDDFFELGGSSLMATQVIAQLREVLKVEVTLQTFFQHPTVARLADELGPRLPAAGAAAEPADDHDQGVL
ncbi:MAG: type I polyketide synthase [Geminicoccaceae bacterium]|nr:type I polyketide synthase [Geminicoccaceae bacterium]